MTPPPAHCPAPDVLDDEGTVLYLGPTPAWMEDAHCKGRTDLFFGIAGERPERRVRREHIARAMCNACPVRIPCRDLARANRENGFWGGETEEERAAAGYPPRSISRRSVLAARRESVAS